MLNEKLLGICVCLRVEGVSKRKNVYENMLSLWRYEFTRTLKSLFCEFYKAHNEDCCYCVVIAGEIVTGSQIRPASWKAEP